jgi:hypothetical protein
MKLKVKVKPDVVLLQGYKPLDLLGNAMISCVGKHHDDLNIIEIFFDVEIDDTDTVIKGITLKMEDWQQAESLNADKDSCPILKILKELLNFTS